MRRPVVAAVAAAHFLLAALWDGGWLPLPRYLLGAWLAVFPDPYRAPLLLGALLNALTLGLCGPLTLRLLPKTPQAAPLAMAWLGLNPFFEKLGLSAGRRGGFELFAWGLPPAGDRPAVP